MDEKKVKSAEEMDNNVLEGISGGYVQELMDKHGRKFYDVYDRETNKCLATFRSREEAEQLDKKVNPKKRRGMFWSF